MDVQLSGLGGATWQRARGLDLDPVRPAGRLSSAAPHPSAVSDSARIEAQVLRVRVRLAAGTAEVGALRAQVARLERLAAELREAAAQDDRDRRVAQQELVAQLDALAETIADREAVNHHTANTLAALEHLLRVARAADDAA